ncbi:MAG: hypothetical protein CFH05_01184 [Alphaproteobacteria bacterium MarineAlpha3_Bin4]|nr:MAG: hypothetical protein CFH05_01184 [Alphaproteobacteria bacterium MarineAlpha3_Bin4]
MAKVLMSTILNASAVEVWKLIGGFNALPDWHPAVENSELAEDGQSRTLSIAGGGTIVEKLENMDDASRTYSYAIIDSPLPVANYRAKIKVTGTGDNSTVDMVERVRSQGRSRGRGGGCRPRHLPGRV